MSYSGESGRKADASNIVEAINRRRDSLAGALDPATGDANRSMKWDSERDRIALRDKLEGSRDQEPILPGFGPDGFAHNAQDDCGDPHPFICSSCGHRVDFGRTCQQSVCARCGSSWCRDAAIKKAAKARRLRREKHKHTQKSEHQKIHHYIISPPLKWWYNLAIAGYSLSEAYEETKDVVKDILEEHRAPGVVARHSFRGEADDGSIASESDDRGEWKERLFHELDWFGDDGVRDELAFKPHFHCIVVTDMLQVDTELVEEQTGWVLHRIQDDDGVSLEDDGAMARALTYCLSHADIDVRTGEPNRSAVWEVGSFEGDQFRSTPRFKARPSDFDWADGVVREAAETVLGLHSATTECGETMPAVDDPDELARKIIEEIYPDHEPRESDLDAVLGHVVDGNISVDVETTSGGGGSVSVRDAFGEPVGPGGLPGSAADLPDSPSNSAAGAAVRSVQTVDVQDDDQDDCGCGSCDDQDDRDVDDNCDGQLIPLGEFRQRGLLEDDDWIRSAPFVDEAREADREHPDDLDHWMASSPGKAVPGVG